jgi:hypothetical protein
VDEVPSLGPLESVTVWGLCVVFREAYNTDVLQVLYLLIDIPSIMLHVEFEDRLSISVMKNRAIHHKNLHLEIVKLLKSQGHFYFKPRPCSNSRAQSNRSRLGALACQSFKMTGTQSKE